jgi:hypothetical protein
MTDAESALEAANSLCQACVELLQVDGASISLMHDGTSRGTFGASNDLSRRLDSLQYTFGEGPCLDAVRQGGPVLATDLSDPREQRWPAFRDAMLESGVHAVFALPVAVASSYVGALDLFRSRRGDMSSEELTGGLMAAELAAVPLLDLMTADVDWEGAGQGGDGWEQLASLERVEVYQATGPHQPRRARAGQGSVGPEGRAGHAAGLRGAPAVGPRSQPAPHESGGGDRVPRVACGGSPRPRPGQGSGPLLTARSWCRIH